MADEQEHETEPGAESEGREPEAKPEGGDLTDGHGQEGISKAKYQRERAAWEAEKKALEDRLAAQSGGRDDADARVSKLEADLKAMRERLDDERVTARLAAAGCVNAKAAKAVLADYDGDVDKLKAECPYLFRQARQTGSTGGTPAGASKADLVAKARKAAGLPPRKG
jgi:hypothetical protein